MDKSRAEYMKGLKRLFDGGEYSDLVIKCRGATYNVHKAVVCTQSEFLAAAARWPGGGDSQTVKRQRNSRGRFTSGSTVDRDQHDEVRAIDLDADDPVAVWATVQYLYQMDYPAITARVKRGILEKRTLGGSSTSKSNEAEETSTSEIKSRVSGWADLHQHAKIYSLAEKYGISSLKHHASMKFKDKLGRYYNGGWEDITACLTEVYTGTPDHDRQLRDMVKSQLGNCIVWIKEAAFQNLIMEVPASAVDMLKEYQRLEKERFREMTGLGNLLRRAGG